MLLDPLQDAQGARRVAVRSAMTVRRTARSKSGTPCVATLCIGHLLDGRLARVPRGMCSAARPQRAVRDPCQTPLVVGRRLGRRDRLFKSALLESHESGTRAGRRSLAEKLALRIQSNTHRSGAKLSRHENERMIGNSMSLEIEAPASEQTDRPARAPVADEQIVDDPLQLIGIRKHKVPHRVLPLSKRLIAKSIFEQTL